MGSMPRFVPIVLLVVALGACSGETDVDSTVQSPEPPPTTNPVEERPIEFGGDRPVSLQVPASYDPAHPVPLLVSLHGYTANATVQLTYTGLDRLVQEGVLLIAPEGTKNSAGNQFWNSEGPCCDFDGTNVDDVGYLAGLIEDISAAYSVSDVFVFGHSNGGFMAYRLACERADLVDSVVSLAGSMSASVDDCAPSEPVNILQIHGTEDDLVLYEGGNFCEMPVCEYPGAMSLFGSWSQYNGCKPGRTASAPPIDLDSSVEGEETRVVHAVDCPDGGHVEVWSIDGGGHIPSLHDSFPTVLGIWLSTLPQR